MFYIYFFTLFFLYIAYYACSECSVFALDFHDFQRLPTQIVVRVGDFNLLSDSETHPSYDVPVSRITCHPGYMIFLYMKFFTYRFALIHVQFRLSCFISMISQQHLLIMNLLMYSNKKKTFITLQNTAAPRCEQTCVWYNFGQPSCGCLT